MPPQDSHPLVRRFRRYQQDRHGRRLDRISCVLCHALIDIGLDRYIDHFKLAHSGVIKSERESGQDPLATARKYYRRSQNPIDARHKLQESDTPLCSLPERGTRLEPPGNAHGPQIKTTASGSEDSDFDRPQRSNNVPLWTGTTSAKRSHRGSAHAETPQHLHLHQHDQPPGSKHRHDEVERDMDCMLRQPDTPLISQRQLFDEVKGIYKGLLLVESKCIEVDAAQNVQEGDSAVELKNEQWQALGALHRALLHEHHDFFLASQHHSASPPLKKLASKYNIPARRQHLQGFFNDQLISALPDTGSDLMLISKSFANRRGLKIDGSHRNRLEVEFADGTTAWTEGVVTDVEWRVGDEDIRCDFYVLKDLREDVILNSDYVLDVGVFSRYTDSLVSKDCYRAESELCNIRVIGGYSDRLDELEAESAIDMTSPDDFGPRKTQDELVRRDKIRDEIGKIPDAKTRAEAEAAENIRQKNWELERDKHRLLLRTFLSHSSIPTGRMQDPVEEPTVAVSAPGKVLAAGGYLVLDQAHKGLVLGLSARINVVASTISTSPGVQLTEIVVTSPQFLNAEWRYGFHLADEDGGITVTQLQCGKTMTSRNPFVEATLTYVLTFIHQALHLRKTQSLTATRLTILADNDYYSTSSDDGDRTGNLRFQKFHSTIADSPKTGLGSSAALVTALTGALLAHYLPASFHIESAEDKRILHNLAQVSHVAAQGKVGSGFDVGAAVYGACVYQRFSPATVGGLPEPGKPGFGKALEALINKEWDVRVDDFTLPQSLTIRMVDVHSGTETVGMVKRVLEWREKNPVQAAELWWGLHGLNGYLEKQLKSDEGNLENLAETISRCRAIIREISSQSGVPIEPPEQTRLLDLLTEVDGVYGGVVPGAGGYDAVAVIAKNDQETVDRIGECCKSASTGDYKVDLMRVKCESEGARMEELSTFDGWLLN
ncbi:uncharacterized protein DNG_05914 [Cephalotrichum gorgonifer]|uniref:phosphomevalonate kinase n=1 Tax=Cephalotrichum gorgonifer TaxID=2041049 RepID=A0AAE8MZ48_9PEZI|nr:uncharacterized protein DNG_05914 [Cephalotrichum gorgonifer]